MELYASNAVVINLWHDSTIADKVEETKKEDEVVFTGGMMPKIRSKKLSVLENGIHNQRFTTLLSSFYFKFSLSFRQTKIVEHIYVSIDMELYASSAVVINLWHDFTIADKAEATEKEDEVVFIGGMMPKIRSKKLSVLENGIHNQRFTALLSSFYFKFSLSFRQTKIVEERERYEHADEWRSKEISRKSRCVSLKKTHAIDYGPEPSFDSPAISECVIPTWFLAWRNMISRVIDESPTKGFTLNNLSKLCCRCAKLHNIADVVFVRFGLNASWYNLLANHIAILAAEDTCLHDLTPNEVIVSNVDPTIAGRVKATAERIASSQPKEPSDATKKIDSQSFRSWSFDFVKSFDLVQSFDFVRSFDRRTRKRVDPSIILLLHVLPTDPGRIGSSVVYKTLIFLGMLVVDDDGVDFSPKGGDYFPTMGDETKKDKCSVFLLLLIICLVLMLMERVSYLLSIQRRSRIRFMYLLLDSLNKEIFEDLTLLEILCVKVLFEFTKQPIMQVVGPASKLDTLKEN
nr:hypothetical protein [Tanacetum cinerariifolium]